MLVKRAMGKFQQGEGVLSLARSFMYAGVFSLAWWVSLWKVNDDPTAKIMAYFYEKLSKRDG